MILAYALNVRKVLFALLVFPFLVGARHRAVQHPSAPAPIRRVFLVVMENQDYAAVLQRPFVARLSREGALLANYHCITHPSQPNYIAMFSGSTWGVKDDTVRVLDVQHLGDLLEARGLSWRVYAERYPGNCNLSNALDNNLYVRRHVPFLEFKNVVTSSARCSRVVNATQLDADIASGTLPTVSIYIPDQHNNGHDSDVDTADAWLDSRFTPLLRDPRFTDGTLFVLTYDESRTTSTTHIAAVLWGASVRRGATSSHSYDHYDLLRTIEETFGLGTLGQQDQQTGEVLRDVLAP